MAFFLPVKFLNKYEVLVGTTKYLYKATTLYTLRDRESDADYDPEETWRFAAWCGPVCADAEHARVFAAAAAGKQKAEGDCLICMESFNLSDHKAVACPACETPYCRTCIQTCLLQDAQPQCQEPACRRAWTDEFLRDSMTKVFMNGPYKAHREKVLVDQERARLPETQEDAMRYRSARELIGPIDAQLEELEASVKALPAYKAYRDAEERRRHMWSDPTYRKMSSKEREVSYNKLNTELEILYSKYGNEARPLRNKMKKLRSDAYNIAKNHVKHYGQQVAPEERRKEPVVKAWTFVMRCPSTACEGFVGLDWKCGMCSQVVCKSCREVKHVDGGDKHACDPDKVASVKALTKEAKPCPKCAAMISKIDGCDQMWCTQCHTAFSWHRGTVETYIHNPHYYAWMRQTGQRIAPVAQDLQQGAAAVANPCLAPTNVFRLAQRHRGNQQLDRWIRQCMHVAQNDQIVWHHRITTQVAQQAEEKRVLRVKRLVKDIDDAEWSKQLQRMEREANKAQRFSQIYDMFVNAAADILRPLLAPNPEEESVLTNISSLAAYADEEIRKINRAFNSSAGHMVTPNI